MASPRYTLNIKPEDLQPEQPKHEMTGKEKRENFWFYHKWHAVSYTHLTLPTTERV